MMRFCSIYVSSCSFRSQVLLSLYLQVSSSVLSRRTLTIEVVDRTSKALCLCPSFKVVSKNDTGKTEEPTPKPRVWDAGGSGGGGGDFEKGSNKVLYRDERWQWELKPLRGPIGLLKNNNDPGEKKW